MRPRLLRKPSRSVILSEVKNLKAELKERFFVALLLRMTHKSILLLLLTAATLITGGCWDKRELSDLSLISAMAVDEAGEGDYLFTMEISGMRDDQEERVCYSVAAPTWAMAEESLDRLVEGELYWNDAVLLALGGGLDEEAVFRLCGQCYSQGYFSPDLLLLRCPDQAGPILEFMGESPRQSTLVIAQTLARRDKEEEPPTGLADYVERAIQGQTPPALPQLFLDEQDQLWLLPPGAGGPDPDFQLIAEGASPW